MTSLAHDFGSGFVCQRCGMSAREIMKYRSDVGIDPVCLGYKAGDSKNTSEWYAELLERSKQGQTEMTGPVRFLDCEILPLPKSIEEHFTGEFPVYSGHEIHLEMTDSKGNAVPIIHKDIPNMDDPIHVQLAVMRVLEALQTQLKTGELKRLHVCLCRMPDGKMKLMATLSAFPEADQNESPLDP